MVSASIFCEFSTCPISLDITSELTPGQMARMIAQVKAEKDYIYCNYADVEDPEKCANVPCASTATSPNCGTLSPTVSVAPSTAPTPSPSAFPSLSSQPTEECMAEGDGLGCTPTTNCCSGECTGGKPSNRVCAAPDPSPSKPSSSLSGHCLASGEACTRTSRPACCSFCKRKGICR